jgi:hypothetical protein
MGMRSTIRLAAGLTLAIAASAPAAAQAASDVRCLMASNLFAAAAKDPKARKLAEAGKYFFLGRVSGQLNEQQVRAQMLAQAKTITPANAAKVMQSCARQMQTGAAMVDRVGKQLAARKK